MFESNSSFSSGFGPSDFGNTSEISDVIIQPPKEAKKQIPSAEIIKQSSQPIYEISSSPFGEYTRMFIYIPQLFNVQLRSFKRKKNENNFYQAFMCIRVHPEIPKIRTQPIVCVTPDPVVNCGYVLDYSMIPPKDLSKYCPVIELYSHTDKTDTLLGTAILPLKVVQSLNIYGKPLKYLYRSQQIDFNDLFSKKVAAAQVTIALGYEEHIEYFKKQHTESVPENILETTEPQPVEKPKPVQRQQAVDSDTETKVIKKKVKETKRTKVIIEEDDDNDDDEEEEEEEEEEDNEKKSRKHKHHRHRHHRSSKSINWIQQALMLGWKPPGSVTGDWKEKAISKGWKPPTIMSSIGVQFNYHDFLQFKATGTQTEVVHLKEPEIHPIEQESSTSEFSNEGVADLINILNKNNKFVAEEPSALTSSEPTVIEAVQRQPAQLTFSVPTNLFDHEPSVKGDANIIDLSDSDDNLSGLPEDLDSDTNIDALLNHISTSSDNQNDEEEESSDDQNNSVKPTLSKAKDQIAALSDDSSDIESSYLAKQSILDENSLSDDSNDIIVPKKEKPAISKPQVSISDSDTDSDSEWEIETIKKRIGAYSGELAK